MATIARPRTRTIIICAVVAAAVCAGVIAWLLTTRDPGPGPVAGQSDAADALTVQDEVNPEIDPATLKVGDLLAEHPGALPEPLTVWKVRSGQWMVIDPSDGPDEAVIDDLTSQLVTKRVPSTTDRLEAAWTSAEQLSHVYGRDLTLAWELDDGWETWQFTVDGDDIGADVTSADSRDQAVEDAGTTGDDRLVIAQDDIDIKESK